MSTAPVPGTYPAGSSHPSLVSRGFEGDRLNFISADEVEAPINIAGTPPNKFRTGQVLATLGRAVEYLIDSRMFLLDQPSSRADSEALQILMRLSRQVFEERGQIVSPRDRRRLWMSSVTAN